MVINCFENMHMPTKYSVYNWFNIATDIIWESITNYHTWYIHNSNIGQSKQSKYKMWIINKEDLKYYIYLQIPLNPKALDMNIYKYKL